MPYDPETGNITWRIHLTSSPFEVFDAISTDSGRARFWAECTRETNETVHFRFSNGLEWTGRILEQQPPERFTIDYFGSRVTFQVQPDGDGGTELTLIDEDTPGEDRYETFAGWISVLMALKAAIDFGIDLRNHDPARSWDQGYADN
jgi:uncharacterized protein YndB with AHSA1/START domain